MVLQMFFSQAIGNVTTNFLGIIITVSFNDAGYSINTTTNSFPRDLVSLS
jgi:hypothetical protein